MTFEDFDKWQAELWAECIKMRDTKGREYSHEGDRFANFNRLANELGISNVTVGWVYLKKHIDSIASYVKDGNTYSVEPIRGRIIDAIVYLTLIGGMIEEEGRVVPDLLPKLGIKLEPADRPAYSVGQKVRVKDVGIIGIIVEPPKKMGYVWIYDIQLEGEWTISRYTETRLGPYAGRIEEERSKDGVLPD